MEADYGTAGTVQGRTAGTEIGQYVEGDYGANGSVGPTPLSDSDPPLAPLAVAGV